MLATKGDAGAQWRKGMPANHVISGCSVCPKIFAVAGVWLSFAFAVLIALFGFSTPAQAQVTLADLTLLNSGSVEVRFSGALYNRRAAQVRYTASFKNLTNQPLAGPFYIAVSELAPASVSIANPDDRSSTGLPVFLLNTPILAPGASLFTTVYINLPERVQFTYTLLAYAQPAPTVSIDSPLNGALSLGGQIAVSGSFTGAVTAVTINNQAANISGASFNGNAVLTPGANTLTVIATDSIGRQSTSNVLVNYDAASPQISITSPASGTVSVTPSLQITGTASDDTRVASVTVNGQAAILSGNNYTASLTLNPGPNTLTAIATDSAGKQSSVSITVTLETDTAPPQVSITSPSDNAILNTATLVVTGAASDDVGVTGVTVNGQDATLSSTGYTATITLVEGTNTIEVIASDASGKTASASRTVTLDATPPTLTLIAPLTGQSTNTDSILVTGEISDANGIAAFAINNASVALTDNHFAQRVSLAEGDNTLTLEAQDGAGNTQTSRVQVTRYSLPSIVITSPADLSLATASSISVSGTVSDPQATVKVNGVSAAVSGHSFIAANVPLKEDSNIITATVTTAQGRISTASIDVVRDLTPPTVVLSFPQDGASVSQTPITVTGMINDLVLGTVNAQQATVTVNGQPAQVANRSFMLTGVALNPGPNLITVLATDASGNTAETHSNIILDTAVIARISVVSGNNQSGPIDSPLAQPLVARLTNAAGQPVAHVAILFKVRDNSGSLDGGLRQVAVVTDEQGQAQAHFTPGNHAGVGNQLVEASSVGYAGPAMFCLSATPLVPARLLVDSGNPQEGIAGQPLPQPFVVIVTDTGFNRLPHIPVTFRVVKGGGLFSNGQSEITQNSDSDGRVSAILTLGPDEGITNNIAEATLADAPQGLIASFIASGRVAGDPSQTSVSGLILDNSDQPVPGVTVFLRSPSGTEPELSARSDEHGLFLIPHAPIGARILHVDGTTATRPGVWPIIGFHLTTLSGRDTTLGRPIYLLPLDIEQGMQIDQTHGGTLTLKEVPGFALDVAPGSVTFPDGSKSGIVSVTVVHSDKIPNLPDFGMQPRIIVSIQPADARFNPPARLTLPNIDGLLPGEVTDMYSFDHDLGRFVSIGPGTVSEDGTQLISNLGVGVLKASWHCGGNPATAGTAHNCPECQKCLTNHCEPDNGGGCTDDRNSCTKNICMSGGCTHKPLDNATSCDDDLYCTEKDSCQSAVCVGTKIEDKFVPPAVIYTKNSTTGIAAAIKGLLELLKITKEVKLKVGIQGKRTEKCCESKKSLVTDLSLSGIGIVEVEIPNIPIIGLAIPATDAGLGLFFKGKVSGSVAVTGYERNNCTDQITASGSGSAGLSGELLVRAEIPEIAKIEPLDVGLTGVGTIKVNNENIDGSLNAFIFVKAKVEFFNQEISTILYSNKIYGAEFTDSTVAIME